MKAPRLIAAQPNPTMRVLRITLGLFISTFLVGGLVKGRVEAPNVSILQSAKMLGDVVHDVLEIEGGAHFHGACQKLGNAD